MIIGLILLAVAAIFMFFGGTERFFSKLGLPNWAAFLIVLALVVGAVIPQIRFANAFSINLGGFLIPLAVMAVFFFLCSNSDERIKALLSLVAVAAVCVAVRMLIPAASSGLTVTISVVIGFVGAAVSCIISQSRLPALAGILGGIVLGDITASIISRFLIDGRFVALGAVGVFDALVIGVVLTLIIAEALTAIRRRGKLHSRRAADMEVGQDLVIESKNVQSVQDSGDAPTAQMEAAQDSDAEKICTPMVYHFNEEDYEDYFNDDID